MYAITASIDYVVPGEWHGTRHLPTFYLDERVQGITSEGHAEMIARDILDPFGMYGGDDLKILAVKV